MRADDYAIIQIHHQFPPLHSPGVIRNFFLAQTFQQKFKQSFIITGHVPNAKRDSAFNAKEYKGKIIQVKYFDFRHFFQIINRSRESTINESLKKNPLSKWFLKLRNTYPFVLFLGDGGLNYARKVFKEIIPILKDYPKVLLYSSYPPYMDHFIAAKIKKKYPHVIWVADFRDLHLEPIYQTTFFPKFQLKNNIRMLKGATLISSISDGLVDQLKKYNRPTHTLYNGLRTSFSNEQEHFDKFTIVYTGSLYKTYRDPKVLFTLLIKLINEKAIDTNSFQIMYAGLHSQDFSKLISNYNLESIYNDVGFIDRNEAIKLQQKAHVNLLLSSSSEEHYGVLTGKFFEYLAALNPILLLINGPKDPEFEKIFKNLKAGFIHHNDMEQKYLEEFILDVYGKWKNKNFASLKMSEKDVGNYFSWENEANKLLENLGFDA